MMIQQNDGVVVEATVISAGLRQALGDGGVSREGEGEARGLGAAALPSPTIYRVPRGGTGPRRSNLLGGRRPRGALPTKARVAPPTPRVSNPRRRGRPKGAHQPTRGWFPSHFSPWGPLG